MSESRAPNLLPVALVLGVLLWIIATTGGRQVFVQELLGEAYDSQAEHLLRGDPGVDVDAIRWEAMIVNGKTRMYFGPFPAFVRMPLNYVYPAGRGHWSRVSGFCAGIIALAAFGGLVRTSLRSSQLSSRWRNWVGNACLVGFAFGSPLLLLLGNLSMYHEAMVWGLAWSLAALYFACRSLATEGPALTRSLVAFSFCVAGALLSRVTFGAPLLLIAPLLGLRLLRKGQIHNLAALFLPLGVAVLFHFFLSYAKFGHLGGVSLEHYINPVQKDFAQQYGFFNLKRLPYSFADYFFLHRPEFQHGFPFLRTGRAPCDHPTLFVHPFTETYSSLLWCSSWITLGALVGVALLLRPKGADGWHRAIAAVLFAQVISILAYMGLEQRYTAEFFPFLVFCLVVLLRSGGTAPVRLRHAIVGLVVLSVVINSLATASWLGTVDGSVPKETRAFWTMTPEGK